MSRLGRIARLALALALVGLLAACSSSTPTGPGAVVQDALAKMAAKDLDGLRSLACAGQEDTIRQQLGLPAAVGSQLLPGLDTQAVLDAVQLDVGKVKVGDAVIDGRTAQVPVTGSMKVTFDAVAMRPIVRKMLDQQGSTMTDQQLDSLLAGLEAFGQDVPVDQTVPLVDENGTWKICQGPAGSPAAS